MQGARSEEIAKLAKEIIRAYFLKHYRKSHRPFFCILANSYLLHSELATGSDSAHTPWAHIGDDPSKFFDNACLPTGFKFQDPSRMGVQVKSLLSHLRQRQEELGVKAFQFTHVLKNNGMEPAEYPPAARAALSSNPVTLEPVDLGEQESPEKQKPRGRSKKQSPTKSKSPRKPKNPAKAKHKSESPSKPPIKTESLQEMECVPVPSMDVFGALAMAPFALAPAAPPPPNFVHIVPPPTTFQFPGANPSMGSGQVIPSSNQEFPSVVHQNQPQYDPFLLAGSESIQKASLLEEPNPAAHHPGRLQNPGYTPMLPQVNPSMMTDPRLGMMFQQFMSQFSVPQGWGPLQPHMALHPSDQNGGGCLPASSLSAASPNSTLSSAALVTAPSTAAPATPSS